MEGLDEAEKKTEQLNRPTLPPFQATSVIRVVFACFVEGAKHHAEAEQGCGGKDRGWGRTDQALQLANCLFGY